MIYKEIRGNELYVWMNGKLLYKRWLKEAYGMIFDSIGQPFTTRDIDSHKKKN